MPRFTLFMLPAALAAGLLLSAACSGDSDGASTATPGPQQPQAEGQLVALTIIDTAGFHAMDTALNGASPVIDPQWLGKVRHGQIAVASVRWPAALDEPAKAFLDAANRLAVAIEADDAKAAAPAAKAAHDTQHELSTEGWSLLAEAAGVQVSGHAEATPTATAAGR